MRRAKRCRESGFTLIEVVIGAALAATISAAAFALLYAATNSSNLTDDVLELSRKTSFFNHRAGVWLRGARALNVDSATRLTIWAADDYPANGAGGVPGDDLCQANEVEELSFDAPGNRLRWRGIRFGNINASDLSALNVTVAPPGTVGGATIDSILTTVPGLAPYVVTEVWFDGVTGCAMISHVSAGGAPNAVRIGLALSAGTTTETRDFDISPVSAAAYLSGSAKKRDGLPLGRWRRTSVPAW